MEKVNCDYFTPDGAINPELVDKEARKWANLFAPKRNESDRYSKEKVINPAQLRRFYGEAKRLEMRWQNSSDRERTFGDILPMIKLLKAKAAYANKRGLVSPSFRDWIWDNVDRINVGEDFKAFLLFFEAVVGFCYGNELPDNN